MPGYFIINNVHFTCFLKRMVNNYKRGTKNQAIETI